MNVVAQRFLEAFGEHGVVAAQIPRLMPEVKLDDLKSEEALLAVLTPKVLDQTAHLFGIRSQWLEGVDGEIYEYRYCYKEPELFFELFAALQRRTNYDVSQFPLRVLSLTKNLDCNDDEEQLLVPILLEKIAQLGDEWIYRYYIYNDGWNWGYAPARIQLKAMVRMVCNVLDISVPLFVISPAELQKVVDRKKVPREFFAGCLITNPSLEDFAFSKEESVVAKEVEEIPEVLRYIEEHRLESLITAEPRPPSPPGEPVSELQISREPSVPAASAPKSGKRAINNRNLWEPVSTVVKAMWAEDGSLVIAKAVSRIKKMQHLKASKLSGSAIRKHIADLAPSNIRGKPGRKPKQST